MGVKAKAQTRENGALTPTGCCLDHCAQFVRKHKCCESTDKGLHA